MDPSRVDLWTKHLDVLADAELVTSVKRGREVHYRINRAGLDAAARWLERRAALWEDRLAALARHVEKDA